MLRDTALRISSWMLFVVMIGCSAEGVIDSKPLGEVEQMQVAGTCCAPCSGGQPSACVSCSGSCIINDYQSVQCDDGAKSTCPTPETPTCNHYLINQSYTTVFGHADAGFFTVSNPAGCSGTAVIQISDTTAASGSWPRTVTMGSQFIVYFSNTTDYSKYPALYIQSVSAGSISSPSYVGLQVVGRVQEGQL